VTLKEIKNYFIESLSGYYSYNEAEAFFFIILEDIFNTSKTKYILNSNKESNIHLKDFSDIIDQLKNFVPIQHITGKAKFYGRDFFVNSHTLIPRPETEQLTSLIINDYYKQEGLKIIDIGTGSGCIAITLSLELRHSEIIALDNSYNALKIAKKNSEKYKAKIKFENKNFFDTYHSYNNNYFDIIVSNPPYIPYKDKKKVDKNVIDYEPNTALFVPDDSPTVFYEYLKKLADKSLKSNGKIYMEINPDFAKKIINLFEKKYNTSLKKDIFGKNRFIIAQKNENR